MPTRSSAEGRRERTGELYPPPPLETGGLYLPPPLETVGLRRAPIGAEPEVGDAPKSATGSDDGAVWSTSCGGFAPWRLEK